MQDYKGWVDDKCWVIMKACVPSLLALNSFHPDLQQFCKYGGECHQGQELVSGSPGIYNAHTDGPFHHLSFIVAGSLKGSPYEVSESIRGRLAAEETAPLEVAW